MDYLGCLKEAMTYYSTGNVCIIKAAVGIKFILRLFNFSSRKFSVPYQLRILQEYFKTRKKNRGNF